MSGSLFKSNENFVYFDVCFDWHTFLVQFERKYNINLYESYGLSEVLFVSTNSPKKNHENVGEVLNGVELKFQNEEIFINILLSTLKIYI
mgnify:CR=1 FL=1